MSLSFSMMHVQRLLSFLFHELISPLSSLVTGLDLLNDDPKMLPEILGILKNASQTLRTRLEYFRSAFGPGGHHLSLAQVQKLITGWREVHPEVKVTFETDGTILDPGVGQSILLVYLWCVHQRNEAHLRHVENQLSLAIDGHVWDASRIVEALVTSEDVLDPKRMVPFFAHQILSENIVRS